MATEYVVLVNEANAVLGTMLKSEVHRETTPLHRGFSLFLFNRKGELLLQRRSGKKKTWPLVWSNSCCGHPALDESAVQAAERRLRDELGMRATFLEEVAPYRYQYTRDGVMENEICPILIGFSTDAPQVNADEVEAIAWVTWGAFLNEIAMHPERYSDWCRGEALILDAHPRFRELMPAG